MSAMMANTGHMVMATAALNYSIRLEKKQP